MSDKLKRYGHRGARGLAPENTLGGFGRAVAYAVDFIEFDVGLTEDDVVVVSHDPLLNPDITRDADGTWLDRPGPALRHLRAGDLARYDVGRFRPGSAYAARFPAQLPQDGARIPHLAEVIAGFPRVGLTIELKTFPDRPELTTSPDHLAEAVICEAKNDLPRLIVQSFDWRALRWLQRHHPSVRLSWLTSPATLTKAALWCGAHPQHHGGSVPAMVAAAGGPIWTPQHDTLDQASLDAAHRLGLQVIPWTVNRRDDMQRLRAWGVDGIITDYPDRLESLLLG